MKKHSTKANKSFLLLVFALLSTFFVFLFFRPEFTLTKDIPAYVGESDRSSHKRKNSNSILSDLKKPVILEKITNPRSLEMNSENLKTRGCQDKSAVLYLSSRSLQEIYSDLDQIDQASKDCLHNWGVSEECFNNSKANDCHYQLLKSRSSLINEATQKIALDDLSSAGLANRLVANIFGGSSFENSEEIFNISDKLLSDYSNNESLHSARGFFGAQTLLKRWDLDVLDKGMQSAEFLISSEDSALRKKGFLIKYSFKIIEYYKVGDSALLDAAEKIGAQYSQNFTDDPRSCYMMMQVYGMRGDRQKVIWWLDKGLHFGSSQTGYAEYQSLRQALAEGGELKPEFLGLRLDEKDQFNPESLIEENE